MVVLSHVEAEPFRSLEQSSLAWDMLQEITLGGVLRTPLCLAGKQSTKVTQPSACGLLY